MSAEPLNSRPDAVVFDLGGVLIDWDPRRLYRKLLADEAEVDWFLSNVCTLEWNAEADRGRPFADGVRILIEQYPDLAPVIRAYQERWDEMLGGAIEGTVNILSELKMQHVPVYALSNWSRETFPHAETRYEFLAWFDDRVISGQEGVAKPDPEIYRLACHRFGIEEQRTVFVDDSPANVAIARTLGFVTHLFRDSDSLRQDLRRFGLLPPATP